MATILHNVHFTHPRQSNRIFTANVNETVTAANILARLLLPSNGQPPFLSPVSPGEQYHLVRQKTNTAIYPPQSLGSAGVQDGDVIQILLDSKAG